MVAPTDQARTLRQNLVELLELLADRDAQIRYGQGVPVADVPAELVCMWFDDGYHPDDSAFESAFSPREMEVLAAFNAVYDAALMEIGKDLPVLVELHDHAAWARVVSAACVALRSLSVGPPTG